MSAAAFALLVLRPRPRALRDGAVGGHDPLRRAQARRARRRAGSSSRTGEGWRADARGPAGARARARRPRGRPGRGERPRLPRARRGARAPRWTASAPSRSRARRRAGRSSTRCARSPRWSTSSNALLALARRPRDAAGHGDERVRAALIVDGELHEVEDARISTVYDGGGRQRSAGLELWLPGEEYSRRGSGQVIAGSSLELDAVQVHAAVFRWRLDGREGIGAYELMVRAEPPRGGVIRALISDFGGVLTTPLSAGFLAYQEEAGVSLEELGRRDGARHRGPRRAPAVRARARRDQRGRVRPPPRGAARRALRPRAPAPALLRAPRPQPADDRAGLPARASAACARRCSPTTCASGSRSGGPSCRSSTRIFEVVVDSAFVGMRKPEPEIYELTLERLGRRSRGRRLPVRGRPRGQLRDGACAGHDARCASSTPSRRSPSSSQRSPSSRASVVRMAPRVRATLSPWCRRRLSNVPQAQAATSAARSVSRSSAGVRLQLAAEDSLQLGHPGAARRGEPAGHHVGLRLHQQRRTAHALDLLEHAAALGHERVDALAQRQRGVDRGQRRHHALVLLAGHRLEQRLAVGEVLEDRALRHPGALGDLRGRGPQLTPVEQREQRLDQRLTGALAAHGAAVALLAPGSASSHFPAMCGMNAPVRVDARAPPLVYSFSRRGRNGKERSQEVVRLAAGSSRASARKRGPQA